MMRTSLRWSAMVVLVVGGVSIASTNGELNMCGPAPERASLEAGTLRENILNLAGEWEGAVAIRYSEKETGSSLASVSCKRNATGDGIVAVFEGYARGEAFQGAFSVRIDERTGIIETTSYDSRSNAKATLSGPVGEVRNAFVATGRAEHAALPAGRDVRQVVRLEKSGTCAVEWFTLDSDGKETLVMSLDISRMDDGQVSAANALFKDAKLLARVDAKNAATANVAE